MMAHLAPQFDPDEPSKRRRKDAVTALQASTNGSFISILLRLGWVGYIAWLIVHAIREFTLRIGTVHAPRPLARRNPCTPD